MHYFFFYFQFIHKKVNPMVPTVMLPTQDPTITARSTDYPTANTEKMTAKAMYSRSKT